MLRHSAHRVPSDACVAHVGRDVSGSYHWPTDWPQLTGAQYVMLRVLRRARPDLFVGAMDADGVARIVLISELKAREWALLPTGQLRHVLPGEPLRMAA